jgi:DnaJ-class molecular chaperone
MQNPYQTLGVNRDATADDIKRAYRRLASQHHPDKGGDKTKFQEIQSAYDTLSDPQRRAAHDNPGFGGIGGGFRADAPFDFQTIFDIFGTRFQHPGQQQQQRRQQARMSLWITLRDVAAGGRRTISVGTQSGTQAVEIEIPPGIDDGDTVQYPGAGPIAGMDLVITYRIHPDAKFGRQGLNLFLEHTVDVWHLITGGNTMIKDLLGNSLDLTIPPRTQPGITVRLRGRGLAGRDKTQGDLLVKLQARIPDHIDPELLAILEKNAQ